MQSLVNKWKNHLIENNMSYIEHFRFATGYGIQCMRAGLYLCIHGICPCFYRHAGSELVHKLEKIFTNRENEINQMERT